MSELVQVLQSLVAALLVPLDSGVLTRAEPMVGSTRGPFVLQPYRDLRRLRNMMAATHAALDRYARQVYEAGP